MTRAFFIFTLACAVTMASVLDNRRKTKPSATLSPPGDFDSTSKPSPNTTTTTHAPNTTTTTHAPNTTTTTHAPNTTTTTHAPNTTTTTHAPNTTTTTHAPNTTQPPQPTPTTNLTVSTYTVKNPAGAMCVKATMAIQIKLQSSSSEMGSYIIQPTKTKADGDCTDSRANLTLSFPEGTLTLLFQKNSSQNSIYVNTVAFNVLYPITHSGPTHNSLNNDSLHLFPTTIGHCYSCKNISQFVGSGYYLEMTSLRLQAFNFTKDDFGLPDNCPADQTDYSVAIAVGVVLIVLIIIVIVVYLIGRRKRTDGYQAL